MIDPPLSVNLIGLRLDRGVSINSLIILTIRWRPLDPINGMIVDPIIDHIDNLY